MTVVSPFVYWAQDESKIFLKVDLRAVEDPDVCIQTRKLKFQSKGSGARDLHDYGFSLDLNGDISTKESGYKITDSAVLFALTKSSKAWWPKLISQPQKPPWLRIDFDRWQSEEDLEDEEVRDVREDYPDLYEQLKREEYGFVKEDIKKVYLTIYNLFMLVGFLYIFIVLSIRYIRDGPDSVPTAFAAVGDAMCFLQLLQFMEVMNAFFGYVKGSTLASLMQVSGRGFVLFALIVQEPRMQTKPAVFYLFMAWTVVEIIRYPYYLTQLYKAENGFLTWLRYTAWIVLYPVGFICEAVVVFRSIIYTEETNKWSVSMPNRLNFTFHFPTFLRIYLLFCMMPGIYFLMSYMYKIRQKKIGPKSSRKRA